MLLMRGGGCQWHIFMRSFGIKDETEAVCGITEFDIWEISPYDGTESWPIKFNDLLIIIKDNKKESGSSLCETCKGKFTRRIRRLKNKNLECDNCKKSFKKLEEFKKIRYEMISNPNNIRNFFHCPHCGKRLGQEYYDGGVAIFAEEK